MSIISPNLANLSKYLMYFLFIYKVCQSKKVTPENTVILNT